MTFTAPLAVIVPERVPQDKRPEFSQLAEMSQASRGGYVTVKLDLPRRPRSTGYRSQNSRHWAHCEDIAQQLGGYTKEQIDAALRRMAVPEGLPTFLNIDAVEEPVHFSAMSVEEAAIVERVKQRFADSHELWLHEYDDSKPPAPYKSVGGRTKAEMALYWTNRALEARG